MSLLYAYRDVDSNDVEAAVQLLAPSALRIEVLLFKGPAQAAKYPPGSKVISSGTCLYVMSQC